MSAPPHPLKVLLLFSVLYSLQKYCEGTASFFPSPRTSCGMARRPVRVGEQFWCFYPLKDLSDIFILGSSPWICETAKYGLVYLYVRRSTLFWQRTVGCRISLQIPESHQLNATPKHLPLCRKVRLTIAYMGHKTFEDYSHLDCDACSMSVT